MDLSLSVCPCYNVAVSLPSLSYLCQIVHVPCPCQFAFAIMYVRLHLLWWIYQFALAIKSMSVCFCYASISMYLYLYLVSIELRLLSCICQFAFVIESLSVCNFYHVFVTLHLLSCLCQFALITISLSVRFTMFLSVCTCYHAPINLFPDGLSILQTNKIIDSSTKSIGVFSMKLNCGRCGDVSQISMENFDFWGVSHQGLWNEV